MTQQAVMTDEELRRSLQLSRQMRAWREALDRRTIPGLVVGRKRYVTQEEAAVLCGRAVSHYGNLERGRIDLTYSDEVLDDVAAFLRLSTTSRRLLYLLATGREPKPGPLRSPEVSVAIRAKIACQPWPAYAVDGLWNVVAFNDAARQWFPHLEYESNAMRAVTCLPQVRAQLLDWDTVWLPRAIARLKGQLALLGHPPELESFGIEIINACPQARHWMYNDITTWLYEHDDVRQMIIPGAPGPTTVVMSADPSPSPGSLHITSIIPIGGAVPAACQAYLPGSFT
jgi:transcriptional regulator with XRE-family HTH domain